MGRILPTLREQVHRETITQSTRYGDQETLHIEAEHWKNTLEIITSIYYPQVERHTGRQTEQKT